MIGVRKNQGRSAAVIRCSTSRKTTFAHATASAMPATSAIRPTEIGIASRKVERVAGVTITFATITTASIAVYVTSCVATTESATSCRGKRTFLTSGALATSARDAAVSELEKNSQTVI